MSRTLRRLAKHRDDAAECEIGEQEIGASSRSRRLHERQQREGEHGRRRGQRSDESGKLGAD